MNLGQIPAKHARLTPEREAVIDVPTGRRITWRELDQRVRRAANGFTGTLGLVPGDRVAILAKNCIEYLETFYACARAGLIAQPLNWRLASAELGRILDDGAPRAVVVSEEYAGLAGELRRARAALADVRPGRARTTRICSPRPPTTSPARVCAGTIRC